MCMDWSGYNVQTYIAIYLHTEDCNIVYALSKINQCFCSNQRSLLENGIYFDAEEEWDIVHADKQNFASQQESGQPATCNDQTLWIY